MGMIAYDQHSTHTQIDDVTFGGLGSFDRSTIVEDLKPFPFWMSMLMIMEVRGCLDVWNESGHRSALAIGAYGTHWTDLSCLHSTPLYTWLFSHEPLHLLA